MIALYYFEADERRKPRASNECEQQVQPGATNDDLFVCDDDDENRNEGVAKDPDMATIEA